MEKREQEKEFEEKYNRYGNMLYKIAFLYLSNASDAEDVLQEVFTRYFFNKKHFNNTEHEKAWLIRITQNRCLDVLKKSERKNISIDQINITATNEKDMREDVLRCILALPPKYKTAIILFYYSNFTVEEISTILKISRSAVKKRLQRGREMLRLELEDYKN